MGYSDQIEILKNSLNGYSAEETRLSELYKNAIENAKSSHRAAQKQRDQQYYMDRNTIFADNARQQRNLDNALSARGLGFSGEAAQSKLNGSINLSNRLGELKREKAKADTETELQLNDRIQGLETDRFQQLRELLENKNDLNADIAKMELDKETADADRLFKKESADADRQFQKENAEADRQAQKENADADRQAEKALQDAKLRAEKEMLDAELQAKYYAALGGGSGGNVGSGGSKGDSVEDIITETPKEPEGDTAYIPDISAKELAQKLVSATGSKSLTDKTHEYMVNKFLLQLLDDYNIDDEYYNDLVFILKAYGYKEMSQIRMKSQVVGYESSQYYDKIYEEEYDKYIVKGVSDATVRNHASTTALNKQLEYIYERSDNMTEFKICCRDLGISEGDIAEFVNLKNAVVNNKTTTGSREDFATREPQ